MPLFNLTPPPRQDKDLTGHSWQEWFFRLWKRSVDGLTFTRTSVSGTYTLTDADEFILIPSGTFTLTLPTAVGFNRQYTIKNVGVGTITLNTTSGQTIDGNASGTLSMIQWDALTLRSDGSNWVIV